MPVTTGDPKNSVITMRPTRAMQRQLADLIAAGYGSQTNVITTAVDRMWRDEYASSNAPPQQRRPPHSPSAAPPPP